MNTSFCESPPTSISPGPHRSSALASQHIRPCATGASPKARRLAWSVSAGWVTWARSLHMRSEPTWLSSRPHPRRSRMRSRSADEMKKHAGSFDFILDAVSAEHDINAYLNLLGLDGNLTLVGAPAKPLGVS